jgi:hypothetical protein
MSRAATPPEVVRRARYDLAQITSDRTSLDAGARALELLGDAEQLRRHERLNRGS